MVYLETKDRWTIGRALDNDLVLQEASISRYHAEVVFQSPNAWILRDLKSSNGTFYEQNRIAERVLQSGDRIQIGSSVILKFVLQDELEVSFQRELYESATKDALTGLFVKRHFNEQMEKEFKFHQRIKKPFSVVIADLDHFKKVNDTYGHTAGDQVLKETGRIFLNILRKGDIGARFGGEELVFALREAPLPGARVFAERIRSLVASHPYLYEGKRIPVTVSLGVATLVDENYRTASELLKAADAALYRAKQAGRNRVMTTMDR